MSNADDEYHLHHARTGGTRKAKDFVEFDYDKVEGHQFNDRTISRDELLDALRPVLTQFCMWQTESTKPINAQTIGMRAIAALWVIKPEAFNNQSLHAISLRFGCSDSILSRYAKQFTARFGVRSASQLRPGERIVKKGATRGKPSPPGK